MKILITLFVSLLLTFELGLESNFEEGYYYTYNGEKVEGLLKLKKSNYTSFIKKTTKILFKVNESSYSESLLIDDIKSFVIAQDSFAIVQDIQVNHINGKFEKDFAKVIETGSLNLYQHQSRVSDGTFMYNKDHFVLSKDGVEFFGIYNLNKQREEISLLIADQPQLMKKFLDKEFDSNIPQLVAIYNRK